MEKLLPENVLEQAYELYLNKKYKESLENYEWFFDKAENFDSNYSGAKYRSLKEWKCLADEYQPALEALTKRKNICLKLFKQNKNTKTFRDYTAVCHALKHDHEVINLFKDLCKTDINFAKSVFPFIENILILNREWALCNMCIDDSMKKYNVLLEKFDEMMRISNEAYNGDYNDIYEKKFERDIQSLFWILKTGKREKEIKKIQSKLLQDLADRNIKVE